VLRDLFTGYVDIMNTSEKTMTENNRPAFSRFKKNMITQDLSLNRASKG
jgi:hypothetical protein